MLRLRSSLVFIVLMATVVGGCTSSSDETTTTSSDSTTATDSTTTTAVEGGSTSSSVPTAFTQDEIDGMCRTLSLFVYSETRPSRAAEGMMATDLTNATPAEMATYGDLLVEAPRVSCLAYRDYADEVAYWIGF